MLSRALVPRHAIIKKFAGEEISQVDDLIGVLSKLSRGDRVPLEFITHSDRHRNKSVLVTVDQHEWYAPAQIYTRDDVTGLWIVRPALHGGHIPYLSNLKGDGNQISMQQISSLPGESGALQPVAQQSDKRWPNGSSRLHDGDETIHESLGIPEESDDNEGAETKRRRMQDEPADQNILVADFVNGTREETLSGQGDLENANSVELQTGVVSNSSIAEQAIERTLVMFEVHVPPSCMLDGVHSQHFFGTGVIIYHSNSMGLVVVDRNTVAVSVSDVMLSFAAFPIEIPAEVVFLHPVHNYAIVAYNPSFLGASGAAAVRAAELLPEPALRRGDSVYLVGLSKSLRVTSRKSTVTNPCAALNIGSADSPRYRAMNMEVIELDTDFGSSFSGVLTDEQGRVQALWGSFSTQLKYGCNSSEDHQFVRGIPIYAISEVLNKIIHGTSGPSLLINGVKRSMPLIRVLEAELYPTLLSKARSFGLSNDWVQSLSKKDPTRRQVLRVKGCLAESKAVNLLKEGDMILAIKDEPITCVRDIEIACHELDKLEDDGGKLEMTIFRQGKELKVKVGTDVRNGNGTSRMVNWCGSICQDPHSAVRALGFLPEEGHGVYVARWCHGSPAHRYGLYALQWIIEINGKPTPDLQTFVDVTKELEDRAFVRVRTVHLNGKPQVLTLKQDLHYWPTWELTFDSEVATWRRRIIKSLD